MLVEIDNLIHYACDCENNNQIAITFFCSINHKCIRQKPESHQRPVYCLCSNSDLNQISHCYIKVVSVRELMRIENVSTQVKFS